LSSILFWVFCFLYFGVLAMALQICNRNLTMRVGGWHCPDEVSNENVSYSQS
jgi:hypothetical protein